MILRVAFLSAAAILCYGASNLPPEGEPRLAHDIYKEIVEIKSGYTTGATTPVVEAVARRP